MAPWSRISWSGCSQNIMDKTQILVLIFWCSWKINFQNHSEESFRNHDASMVADPKLVPDNDAVTCGLLYNSLAEEIHNDITAPREQVTSTVP